MLENVKLTNIGNETNKTRRRKEYTLRFDEETAKKIHAFCNAFSVESNDFFEKTVLVRLYAIQADIEDEEFQLVSGYFDVSKLFKVQTNKKSPHVDKKKCKFKVAFDPSISNAIEEYCEVVRWTPEEFIEDVAEWKINWILSEIKRGYYNFLVVYLNFSKAIKSFKKIVDESYNQNDN